MMADDIFRYTDSAGRVVYTNEPEAVPAAQRATLEAVDMDALVHPPWIPDAVGGVHLASAALGATVAIIVFVLLPRLRRARWVARVVAGVAAIVLVGGLYFGWVMRTALGTGGMIASPTEALEEARRTLGEARESAQQRERAIDKLQE
jgi:hypothetical protein